MKNHFSYVFNRIVNSLTGKELTERDGTDIQIASGTATTSTSAATTVASFVVPAGTECIIGDVDFGASGAAVAEISVTYTPYPKASAVTITRYVYLSAAGFINEEHDFDKRPFFAIYNSTAEDTPATVTMSVPATSAALTVYGNIAYALRITSE